MGAFWEASKGWYHLHWRIDNQGIHEALSYGHLYRIRFDASVGITLEFTEHVVTIRGKRLNMAYQRLAMHRVVFVAEADRPTAALVTESEPVVYQLDIRSKRDKPDGQ